MPDSDQTKTREDYVEAFQKHIGAQINLCLGKTPSISHTNFVLERCSSLLHNWSKEFKTLYVETNKTDERLMRAQLMLEELGEAILALSMKDEVGLLDALADLTYVVSGTATTYDLPLDAAFNEVHRSNMTKGEVHHAEGIKGKGEGYSAPCIEHILAVYRLRN